MFLVILTYGMVTKKTLSLSNVCYVGCDLASQSNINSYPVFLCDLRQKNCFDHSHSILLFCSRVLGVKELGQTFVEVAGANERDGRKCKVYGANGTPMTTLMTKFTMKKLLTITGANYQTKKKEHGIAYMAIGAKERPPGIMLKVNLDLLFFYPK